MKKQEKLELIKQALENFGFNVYEYKEQIDRKEKLCGLEIETWTDYGVNMIEFLDFRDDINSIYDYNEVSKKIRELAYNFDIDEEIDMYRQDEKYRKTFKVTQSVYDFGKYADLLEKLDEDFKDEYERLKKEWNLQKRNVHTEKTTVLEDSMDIEI